MRAAFVVFVLSVVALAVMGFVAYRYALHYPDRPAELPGKAVSLTVPRGASFPKVVALLEARGLISSPVAFRIYANYKGEASKVRAGTYKLASSITPRALLNILVHGVPAPTVTVTIPEGKNMLEVAAILARAKVAREKKLLRQMRNVHFLHRIGISGETMEGFLFPDTYRFRARSDAQSVLQTLYRRHMRVYVALRRKHPKGLLWLRKNLGWGHREITILASIVEKETGRAKERPIIAGVFLNRLMFRWFQPKLLQTDPTIVYGCTIPEEKSLACEKFKGRIRRMHLDDRENPYNTYTQVGLPPGPIANPGRAALEAVLAPDRKGRYLYFVSKNDGTHQFSRTRAEHKRAVDRYQRKRKAVSPAAKGVPGAVAPAKG